MVVQGFLNIDPPFNVRENLVCSHSHHPILSTNKFKAIKTVKQQSWFALPFACWVIPNIQNFKNLTIKMLILNETNHIWVLYFKASILPLQLVPLQIVQNLKAFGATPRLKQHWSVKSSFSHLQTTNENNEIKWNKSKVNPIPWSHTHLLLHNFTLVSLQTLKNSQGSQVTTKSIQNLNKFRACIFKPQMTRCNIYFDNHSSHLMAHIAPLLTLANSSSNKGTSFATPFIVTSV